MTSRHKKIKELGQPLLRPHSVTTRTPSTAAPRYALYHQRPPQHGLAGRLVQHSTPGAALTLRRIRHTVIRYDSAINYVRQGRKLLPDSNIMAASKSSAQSSGGIFTNWQQQDGQLHESAIKPLTRTLDNTRWPKTRSTNRRSAPTCTADCWAVF